MSNEIDLTQLPAPNAIEYEAFEDLLEQNKERLLSLLPPEQRTAMAQVLQLESEPVVKLLQVLSYVQLIESERVNEGVLAGMLAFADKSDLDHFAIGYGLSRKVIQAANPNTNPPIAEILESDEDFRRRIQMHPEKFAAAGPRAAYIAHALDVDNVADANPVRTVPGTVAVYIKSHDNNGIAKTSLVDTVQSYLSCEDKRPLCDTVIVSAAKAKSFAIEYVAVYESGPDMELVKQEQAKKLQKLLHDHRGIAAQLATSKIIGALDSVGVQKITLINPKVDIVCADNEFINVTSIVARSA